MAKDDKEQMDDLIAEMISEKNLDWTWAGEVENVDWYYKNARCLIIPSRWEGVPNVLIEAMLAGCPVISTPVSDIPYILGDSNCGIVCEGVEARHISSGIQLFDELEPQAIDDMRLRAQQYAVENFSIDSMTDKYIQAINEVCL
jgi:glycosyltransferase involved in cell wall biosynthesis